MSAFATVLGAALVAAFPIAVEGGGTCPAARDVSARLRELLPADSAGAAPNRAIVARGPSTIHVRLYRPSTALVAERVLPAAGSCRELADAVAVALAAWAAELQPGDVPAPRLAVAGPAPAAPPEPLPLLLDVGLAGLTSLAAGGPVLAASAEAFLGRRRRLVGLHVALRRGRERTMLLPRGSTTWHRTSFELGPSLRLGGGRLVADLHAGLAASFLAAGDESLEGAALTGGARLGWAVGPVAPWLGVAGLWPAPGQRLDSQLGTGDGSLSFSELTFGLGVSFGRWQ